MRKPLLKWLLYETPIIHVLVFLAKLNYPIWLFFFGSRIKQGILTDSRYSRQYTGLKPS